MNEAPGCYGKPMTCAPAISVVMPARNVEAYVDAAVESILKQSVDDFELIIRDDGSVDGTSERLRGWANRDPRVRLFEGPQLGLSGSSNWLVQQARAPLIARMDADDIARPDRLERQLEVLRSEADILLVGSLADTIDANGKRIRGMDHWRIVRRSWFPPFPHASIMFRRQAFEETGGYHPLVYCEDWDFFLRMASHGRVTVIADALVSHRVVSTSSSGTPDLMLVVENATDRMLQAINCNALGRNSDQQVTPQPQRRVHPFAIISSNSTRLWAGGHPRVVGELLRRGRLGFNLSSLGALGWASLAQFSPALLKLALRTMWVARNCLARLKVRKGRVYDWVPGGRGSRGTETAAEPLMKVTRSEQSETV